MAAHTHLLLPVTRCSLARSRKAETCKISWRPTRRMTNGTNLAIASFPRGQYTPKLLGNPASDSLHPAQANRILGAFTEQADDYSTKQNRHLRFRLDANQSGSH